MLVLVNALEQSEDSALFYQAGPSTSNSTFTSKNTQERALISCVPVFINGERSSDEEGKPDKEQVHQLQEQLRQRDESMIVIMVQMQALIA